MAAFGGRAGRAPALLFVDRAQGLHPGAGHRPDRGDDRSGAGHGLRQDGASIRSMVADIIRQDPERRRRWSRRVGGSAAAARSADRTSGRSSCTSSRAASARAGATEIIERLRPQLAGCRACRSTCRIRRPSASAARSARACISSRCSRRIKTQLYAAARNAAKRAGDACPALQDLTSDLADHQPAGERRRSIATRRRRSA